MSFRLHSLWLLLLLALLGGCSGVGMSRPDNPEMPYPPPRAPQVGDVLHFPTGLYVSREAMLSVVADARVVYVGETHDNPASHRLERDVLQAMADRWPGQVALGMEMFTPAQQQVLDAWVAGALTEKEFLKQSNWYGTWRMDFGLYRDLLQLARERRIPIRGLNAEKDLVRAVGRKGLDALTLEQRRQVPEMDLEDPYQNELVEAIYGGHSAGHAMLDGFRRVQTLWDETMAQNVAAYLQQPGNEQLHMLVIAGGNHVRNGFGIPRRVFRRLPTSYALVGSKEIVIPKERRDRLMNVSIPAFPMPPYDYLVYTRYEINDAGKVKLGVMLGEDDGKVTVGGVAPESNAERAGIRQGDVILKIGDQQVKESFDLVYVINQLKPGDEKTLLIERDGRQMEVRVTFEKSKPMHHGKK
ncbi:hypothetical protein C2E25_06860 [Geothermobacter hydrogeniphilus]|uniref:PDZ domain-containing protein n=1 Tax=Geothermobacter hydrogeniphilus TaxID=1969733 RepID=A0A2K2HBH9_9BACT|nr:ChaN family lipoprotein [Geothermobacter hydrogeniphilus]PNU20589.1 hypothetical protein C2E25_06860 [Geothermobacter hydrogeniphilus]